MNVSHIMPEEAARLVKEEGYVYVDVRSITEFEGGHPDPALNVPILHADPRTGQMTPNLDFLEIMEALFPKDTKLVMGCRSGQRSARATEALLDAGYATVVNMRCGFSGERNPLGQVVNPGWMDRGLPVSADNGEGVCYASLAAKAGK
ncbi:MAG: rhodanese-like domain-containing protein [candidate division Zixibacteria bacterium]|nr:rhodanese-like domain-containing protein [candidate division Zixibacteria bacterium]